MAVPVSFGKVEAKSFEALPVGKYLCKVTGLTYNPESSRSGEPTLAWEFGVSEGGFAGRKAFLNTSLQEQALWSTMRILTAIGYTDDEIKSKTWDFEDPDIVDDIVGRDCMVSISHQKFEGETRQRVRKVSSASGQEF